MGFFKSVKKKLSKFKRQVRKILPRELVENPALTAALIIGGGMVWNNRTAISEFAKGKFSGFGTGDVKGYFDNLNDRFGFGEKAIGKQPYFTSGHKQGEFLSGSYPIYKKGFLGRAVESTGKSFLSKYLAKEVIGADGKPVPKPTSGDRIQVIQTGSTRGDYRIGTKTQAKFSPSTTPNVRPGYKNRYVQSSIYNILNSPQYKNIWLGSIADTNLADIARPSGVTTKLPTSTIG